MENPLGQRLRELPGPVLLTGHTGFKGTWMTFLLEYLGIPIVGYSLPPEKDTLFERAARKNLIPEVFADIRDYQNLEKFIDENKPSTIIHMAAQPLVLSSYENPRETFDVNVMGTVNVLDIAFKKDFIKAVIVVTTDKVYRNDNSGQAFVEHDPLEGKDPYSASKVGTESVVAAWQQISEIQPGPKIASVRAGNVIGGGDFAKNRIVPDLIRSVLNNQAIEIRNPDSIRPWQHVLDPSVGYLNVLERLSSNIEFAPNSINFGPIDNGVSVQSLVNSALEIFSNIKVTYPKSEDKFPLMESKSLHLNSNLAQDSLGWQPKWSQEDAIAKTFIWWRRALLEKIDVNILCRNEIQDFFIS
jgi:CDP-glucose 4,6-dehydratase